MKIKLANIMLPIVFMTAVLAQDRYVMPVDEAKMDASLVVFRTKLIKAVERRDSRFILSIVDPKIRLSFGSDEGLDDFKKMWKINERTSKFWDEFLVAIKNGGTFFPVRGQRTNLFYAPYSFNAFPIDLDAFEHCIIFGSGINLRDRPDTASRIVGQLSYNIVKIDQDATVTKAGKSDEAEWYKIRTLGGKTGYVKAEYIRSPIDYRAGFEKKHGRWRMVTFIAGD